MAGATAARPSKVRSLVPGDTAYYHTFFTQGVQTAPIPTLDFTLLGGGTASMFGISFDNAATTLYGLDQDSRQFGTLDQSTGAFSPIAPMNPDPGLFVTGLTNDPTSTLMYATLTDGVTQNLYTIDPSTATLTLVGSTAPFALIIDIRVDGTGQMYGHDIGTDELIAIDKTTGATSAIGPTGIDANFAQGMMYDASDDTLYGCIFDNSIGQTVLVEFDRTSGAANILDGPVADEAECAAKVPAVTGPCTAPIFGGLSSAENAGSPTCAINLDWNAALACPGTEVVYNVYRSTVAGTPPSAATLIAACLTSTDFVDTGAISGVQYFYIVRAEDDSGQGDGACANGIQDSNTTERSATAAGPPTVAVSDNVESGGANWSNAGGSGTNVWAIVAGNAHSPVNAWFVSDPDVITLQPLRWVAPPVAYPPGGGIFSFWQQHETEDTFDGHVLEYSLDGGVTWSDILAGQGTVPANPNRFIQNGYTDTISTSFGNPLGGRRAWSGSTGAFQEVIVDMADFGGRSVNVRYLFGSDDSVPATGVWLDDFSFAFAAACNTVPNVSAAPAGLIVDDSGNDVYEPNETVVVAPSWRNTGAAPQAYTGALTNHTGPAGPVYSIPDGTANYGVIPVAVVANCSSTGDCYMVSNSTSTRPATHWDSSADETVSPTGATKTWILHVGESFTDVPTSNGFYRFIETILHNNVTVGCTADQYCPGASTTREAMAPFVLVASDPGGAAPPNCVAGSEAFTDVPASSPFCRWIEELFRRGVVTGCGTNLYCPTSATTREQMAVFVLRTLDPNLVPPACVAGAERFDDVPASSGFCPWIEELARRGVVTGCSATSYCPTAEVTREQMSVFLAVTFGLRLYGL